MASTAITDRQVFRFRQSEQTLRFNIADQHAFERTYAEAPVIAETIAEVHQTGVMGEGEVGRRATVSLQFDCQNEMVKANPKPSGYGDQLATEIMRRVRQAKSYQELKSLTAYDDVSASLAACSLTSTVACEISDELKKEAERQREADRHAEEMKQYAEQLADDPEATPEQHAEAAQAAADAQEDAKAAAAALASRIRDHGKQIATAVAKGVDEAMDSAQAAKAAGECFGWGKGSCDPNGGLPPEEKFRLARMIQNAGPHFKKFIELLGRTTRVAMQKQASKTQHAAGEIVDITLGSDLGLILEDELLELVNPDLQLAAMARFASDSMMQHEVEEKEPMGKGDIVVLIDESGSMSGQREAEAKAVALALAHVCAKQKRKLVIHFFQDTVTFTVNIDPADAKSSENGVNVAVHKMGLIARRGTAGGTSFDAPLMQACKSARASGLDRPDILMITDGCCVAADSTVQALNDLRASTGAKVYTMLIGAMSGTGPESVAKFSDKVWNADTLLGKVADEFFEMI